MQATDANSTSKTIKPTQKAIKAVVKHIYSKIDAPFQTFSKLVLLKPKLKLLSWIYKQKKAELKRNANADRGHVRSKKQKVHEEWSKRDADTMLATTQSFSQRAKEQSLLYYGVFQGSHCPGRKTEEDGRSWEKKA